MPGISAKTERLELWGGVECTINRVGEAFHNQLAARSPAERLQDIDRVVSLGIRTLRFPLLWEELAPEENAEIDWSAADAQMRRLRELGVRPIVGLLHHGSGPRYTSLVDPRFPERLARYARAVAERYPWVQAWTPINEPLTTARFSGLYGHWFPHGRDPRIFCRAFVNQIRAIGLAMRAIRAVNPAAELVQTEDLGVTLSTPALVDQAEFENERRWLSFDLLGGTLDRRGRGWGYLREQGISESELTELVEHPCPPALLGINHYITSSRFLDENPRGYDAREIGGNGRDVYADVAAVRAQNSNFFEPRELLRQAWERFGIPIAVTEAHLCCTREEQLRWFGELWSAASLLHRDGLPIIAVTAWSLLGAYDWDSLLTRADGHYEPGAFDLRSPEPRATALASLLRQVARTSECENPLLRVPGWWRRSVRIVRRHTPTMPLPQVFAPRANRGCPMLLIAGADAGLGDVFARMCHLRGLPYRRLSPAEMDVTDAPMVRAAIRAFQPWAIIHAEGCEHLDARAHAAARDRPTEILGAATLAAACAPAEVALLTFSSDLSSRVNGTDDDQDFRIIPVEAERRTALIVKTSGLFGIPPGNDFISRTVHALSGGKPIEAAANEFIRLTYVPDLVHASLDLLIDRERGLWHLTNSGAPSWTELAHEIARIIGADASLVTSSGQVLARVAPFKGEPPLLNPWHNALRRYFEQQDETHAPAPCPQAT
ncbi:MAG: dTDP-4-dehydrorhamnose reductase [Chthoniobacter sp.]|nr:dTDP-4-dehydrorhamnose reductase [Chthoniobacter sp.]